MQQPTRLFDIPRWQAQHKALPDALARKIDGQWRSLSTQDMIDGMDRVARGLLALGLQRGDKIALISNNRPEWNLVDFGALQLGITVVPLYPTATADDYQYIVQHSECKIAFVEGAEYYHKLHSRKGNLPGLQAIYTFDALEKAQHWSQLWTGLSPEQAAQDLQPYRDAVQPTDLATLVYTSGTTGMPKGVMLTHNNIVSNMLALNSLELIPNEERILTEAVRALSFLPLCHVLERMAVYAYMYRCISVYYAESIDTLRDNLQELKPHLFATVPRLLEKVYDRIVTTGMALTGVKRKLFFWSLGLGLRYGEPGTLGNPLYMAQLAVARKLVFSKWQAALGGNLELIVSGGAALAPRLQRVFWAAGIRVQQGYGLTETSPVATINTLGRKGAKIGSVGRILPGVEVKIAPEPGYPAGEGEILIRGSLVMQGYYKNPQATAEAIDPDGWFHSGDIGKIDGDGFLFLTDRKKEIFKTSGGKYIAPQAIENRFKESLLIEQIMVVGENQKFPSALIVPSFDNLREWASQHNLGVLEADAMLKHPTVLEKFQREVDRLNEPLAQFERIKKFALLPREWTTHANELTPTQKLKRRVLTERNRQTIEQFYAD